MYKTYKLSDDDSGLNCTANGLACGGLPLVTKSAVTGRFEPCNQHLLQKSGIVLPVGRLQAVAKALNENNTALAMIAALHLMPALGPMAKAGYRDDEPRDDQGRWTTEADGSPSENLQDGKSTLISSDKTADWYKQRKENFVDAHLADAQKIADQLGTTVENILGLSAYESGWGDGPFATNHNYFSIHAKPSDPNGIPAKNSDVKMEPYKSYADNAQDFANQFGNLVQGEKDPVEFARKLQDSGKYGIEPKTGAKVPYFVPKASQTMIDLRPLIARRSL
jgi:hypothetical protein